MRSVGAREGAPLMEIDPLLEANRANWEARVPVHLGPGGYRSERYLEDPEWISEVVEFDIPKLGDLTGLSIAHLQCHIGTDTVSLARLGPAEVVGIDFSPTALAAARQLAEQTDTKASFVLSDVYNAASTVGRQFDLLYTSVGTITWLDDINRWAANVAGLIRPGGRFVFRDMHPLAWTYEEVDGEVRPEFDYWHRDEPVVFNDESSYLGEGKLEATRTNEWNHTVSDVLNALIKAGMRLDSIDEHEGCDWAFVPNAVQEGDQWFFSDDLRGKVPVCWSVTATRTK